MQAGPAGCASAVVWAKEAPLLQGWQPHFTCCMHCKRPCSSKAHHTACTIPTGGCGARPLSVQVLQGASSDCLHPLGGRVTCCLRCKSIFSSICASRSRRAWLLPALRWAASSASLARACKGHVAAGLGNCVRPGWTSFLLCTSAVQPSWPGANACESGCGSIEHLPGKAACCQPCAWQPSQPL